MRKLLTLLFLCFIILACEEIIGVEDISQDEVVVLAPKDETVVTTKEVNLSWESIDFATSYKIQVSKPDFENAAQLPLDTVVMDTVQNNRYSLTTSLSPGEYSWRIRGENSGYITAYSTQHFSVSESSSLEGQSIELISPADNLETTSTTIGFSWEGIDAATAYRFELLNTDTNIQSISTTTSSTSYTYTFSDAGNYEWQVRAENESEITDYSERTITIILD